MVQEVVHHMSTFCVIFTKRSVIFCHSIHCNCPAFCSLVAFNCNNNNMKVIDNYNISEFALLMLTDCTVTGDEIIVIVFII